MVSFAIDIGQTQARIRVISDGAAVDDVQIDGFAYGGDLLTSIAEIVGEGARRVGQTSVDAVAVGSTGLYGQVPSLDELGRHLERTVNTSRLVVADDAVTAYLGALGDSNGVVIAAGTGLVGMGHGPNGAVRVDGVGAMIGDDGSGWWIGRRGLIAAVSAADGRWNASSALLERLESRFGPVAAFPGLLASSASPVAMVASFAKDVAEVAREGDSLSTAIWREAGDHIGSAVAAAAARAGLGSAPRWALIGRLSQADDLLRPGIDDRLGTLLPVAERVQPVGSPLEGVARLFEIAPTEYAPMVRVHTASPLRSSHDHSPDS